MRRFGIEFRRVGILPSANIPCKLDDRALHPQADAEKRQIVLTGITHRLQFAVDAPIAETRRDENARHVLKQLVGVLLIDLVGEDVLEIHLHAIGGAGQDEALGNRLVGILMLDVLADERHAHVSFRILELLQEIDPLLELRLGGHTVRILLERHIEPLQNNVVHPLLLEQQRHLINRLRVERGDDGSRFDVAKQGDLLAQIGFERPLRPADKKIRL